MNELISNFPRQLSCPQRVTCQYKETFYKKLNEINGIKTKIYFSIYNCNEDGKFLNPMIDKIGFDLDSNNCIKTAKHTSPEAFVLYNRTLNLL